MSTPFALLASTALHSPDIDLGEEVHAAPVRTAVGKGKRPEKVKGQPNKKLKRKQRRAAPSGRRPKIKIDPDVLASMPRDLPVCAFTIREFCHAHRLSERFYRELRQKGLAPKELRLLGKILITEEAAHDWRIERERGCENT